MPNEKQSFWTTLPGLLTALAALITALVGAYTAITNRPAQPVQTSGASGASSVPVQPRVHVARVMYPGGGHSHAFFTPQGYLITLAAPLRDAPSVTVVWESDQQEQRVKAQVIKRGAIKPEVALLQLVGADAPKEDYPVRNASSLQKGTPIQRYLGPGDRTPGTVQEIGVARTLWRSATESSVLRNALITSDISGQGDAGAPVIDAEERVVAMVYGGKQGETISIPIEDIKADFREAFR